MFNVDPHQDNLADMLNAALLATEQAHQQHSNAPLHTYAFIDGAFDDAWGSALLWLQRQGVHRHVVRSLYTGSQLEALEECAPFLAIIEPDGRLKEMRDVLAKTGGKPMLTFIQSSLDLFALQKHLLRFSQIATPDTLVFPLRFADSIGLPDILDVFTAEQRAAILSGITAWQIIDRKGGVFTIEGSCRDAALYTTPGYGDVDRIPFTDAQYVQLIESSEADELLTSFSKIQMPVFKQVKVSLLFERVQTALQEMDRRQIKDEGHRKILAQCCLMLSDPQKVTDMLDVAQRQGVEAALASL